ncbi:uncharacterized protein [Diadema antillarum]|uniref:uncharacterized protein n=1 Tax=Diadema antillarum TaxID=105358 RepID=UPI003A85F630
MSKGELKGIESIRNFLARQTNETDINVATSDGMTALMIACGNGQEDIVRFLIENGANPNISSPKNGDTSLHVICRKEKHSQQNIAHETRVKIVQTLLQHGATFRKNEAGLTPLQLAALSPLDSLVEFFISYQGSDIEIAEADKIIALEMLGLSQCLDGQKSRSFDILHKLVSRGYDPPEGRRDPELVALFHYPEPRLDSFIDACVLMRITDGLEIYWILTGDRIIPEGAKGKYLFTRLANCARSFLRHPSDMSVIVDLARIVIRHGCPVNQRNDDYCTALNKVMQDNSFRLDDDASKELVDLLNPTSSLLTLEEMASRTILQNRIPYHGVLPKTICEKIEGETMVPDIGTLIDSDDGTDSQNLNSEGTDSQNSDSETDSKYSDSETDSQ